MTPTIALALCLLFIIIIFALEFKRHPDISTALWIPLAWILILASRPLGTWFSSGQQLSSIDYETGSPIDRGALILLIIVAIMIITKRKVVFEHILQKNTWLVLLVLYFGISIIWSDFPGVAFKRWIRGLGSILMILVVLSEHDPIEAIRALFRRCTYALIPLSILLIKYYRDLGVGYNFWSGREMMIGVATDKNGLGRLCLICGVSWLWNISTMMANEKKSADWKERLVSGVLFVMIIWLLIKSGSATSLVSFMAACFVFLGLGVPFIKRNIKNLGSFILLAVFIGALAWSFNLIEIIVGSLGRDMTFTERTLVWRELGDSDTNPVLGVGYDSFWLGERLETFIRKYQVNEAHNGYLEVYLELGIAGLFLFTGFLISTYRKMRKSLVTNYEYGRIGMTVLFVFLMYNVTEAAYKATTFMGFSFLLLAIEFTRNSNYQEPFKIETLGGKV